MPTPALALTSFSCLGCFWLPGPGPPRPELSVSSSPMCQRCLIFVLRSLCVSGIGWHSPFRSRLPLPATDPLSPSLTLPFSLSLSPSLSLSISLSLSPPHPLSALTPSYTHSEEPDRTESVFLKRSVPPIPSFILCGWLQSLGENN